MKIHIDIETYSEVDLSKVGVYKYAAHPSTRILMIAYSVDGGPVEITEDVRALVDRIRGALEVGKYVELHAFNANFERVVLGMCFSDLLSWPPLWHCTMVDAYAQGFSGGLDTVAKAIGVPEDKEKMKQGKALINKFCKPQPANRKVSHWNKHNAPEDWEMFKEYCKQDVVAEMEVHKLLQANKNHDYDHHPMYVLDQRINDRGLPIDTTLVQSALEMAELEKPRLVAAMKELTGLDNPNSGKQLLHWLDTNDVPVDNLQKTTVAEAIKNAEPGLIKDVLVLKSQLAKSSTAKWNTLNKATVGGRLCGSLQLFGAGRTGRYAGRLFQPQNLPRPTVDSDTAADMIINGGHDLVSACYESPMEVLSSSIRAAICAPEGYKLVVTDLKGIEGRVLPWLCGFTSKLDKIAAGTDMYKVAAAGIYHCDYDAVDSTKRFTGKVAELALGYQGAIGALNQMGAAYGVEFADAEANRIVAGWRNVNKPIVQFWYNVQQAAMQVLTGTCYTVHVGRVSLSALNGCLFITLPSGRRLTYWDARVVNSDRGLKITYMGKHPYTSKWTRLDTYGGKLVENITQAVAADILLHNMPLIDDAGYPIVGTVHDEVITLCEDTPQCNSDELDKLMSTVPVWAEGLPLESDGYESMRYKK